MIKDILLIAHFCSDFDGTEINRFNYLANLLADKQFQVEMVTSDFSHNKKRKRASISDGFKYKVTYISEPIYKKNVSLKRIYSHHLMSRNLRKYLDHRKKPDIIYCAVPSLAVGEVVASYAQRYSIRLIIDVQDLWPEAFKMVINVPSISNVIFKPMEKQANYIYGAADEIIAVSDTYVKRALKANGRCKKNYVVYLGTDLSVFDKLAMDNKYSDKPSEELWIGYIGTLGHSYDITVVIDALKILKDKGIMNIKFVVMGDGPLKDKFQKYGEKKEVDALFTGRLAYGQMVGLLRACDMAVNPISPSAAQSITNKLADYAAASLPVLNTQQCPEYRSLVNEYQIGINCENNNAVDLAKKILQLCEDIELRISMGLNNRRLAEDKFDRFKTYEEIVDIITGR